MSVSDLWRGMVSGKSHVSELKNWMPMHSKKQKMPSVGVELRAGRDTHRSEKPGWSVGDMKQWSKQKKMHRYPVSPTGVSLLVFFYLFKVSKIIFDLFKFIKITCDSFKVCEMTIFNYSLFKVSDSGGKWSNPGNFLKARFVIFGCQKICKKRVHRNDQKKLP